MAETNGMAEIKVGGVKYSLLFGRAAVQEMADLSSQVLTGNSAVLLANLIWSGMMNYNIRKRLPSPIFEVVFDLAEQLADEDDAKEQEKLLWETFEKSRWGSEWIKELEEIKKKVMEMSENLPQ